MNIVFLLAVIAIIALVAAQNATPVTLTFLFWNLQTSLSVVIFCSLFAGVLIVALFLFSGYVRRAMKSRRQPEEARNGAKGGEA